MIYMCVLAINIQTLKTALYRFSENNIPGSLDLWWPVFICTDELWNNSFHPSSCTGWNHYKYIQFKKHLFSCLVLYSKNIHINLQIQNNHVIIIFRLDMIQSILLTIFPSLDHSQATQLEISQISVSAAMSMCPDAGPSGQIMDQEAVFSMVKAKLECDYHSQLQ